MVNRVYEIAVGKALGGTYKVMSILRGLALFLGK